MTDQTTPAPAAPSPTAPSSVTMYGADWCIDCRRAKGVLDADGVAYEYVNLEEVAEAADIAKSISGRTNIPVIVFPDGSHLVEPSDAQLRDALAAL